MKTEDQELVDTLKDLRDRAIRLSDVRQYCMELLEGGDTTPKEKRMLFEILRVSGMEALK